MIGPRVLTVQPPWSWAIAHGGKDLDNRTDCKNYQGELFIHAGKRWSERGEHDKRVRRAWRSAYPGGVPLQQLSHHARDLVMRPGHIVAVCELVDCHPDEGCCRPWGESSYVDGRTGKRHGDLVHMIFENVTPVFGPAAHGRMGLWYPDDVTLQLVRERLS